MERELLVFMGLDGAPVSVGRLWARVRQGRASSSFVYDAAWLQRPGAFALSPALPLVGGQFHAREPLAAAFTDPAPDSWGQRLMRRAERARATTDGRQPRTLFPVDFLAGVDDRTRLGALRFKDATGDDFLTLAGTPIPPLIDLKALLAATDRFDRGRETNNDVALVLAPGTSLGGARPKATVSDNDGSLLVAKFPKRDDDWPVTRWEHVALTLAEAAGIVVPVWRLEMIAHKAVVLLGRFDRVGGRRIPLISAMTALDAADHDGQHSYLEIVDFIRQHGARPGPDLEQLWRRIAFNILISNTDDHLRNHAFLRAETGWRLAPAYDMNPCPVDVKPRIHALAINEQDATASMETAYAVAAKFGLKQDQATAIAGEVATAVANWRATAKKLGLKPGEVDRMASAFEHEDRDKVAGAKKVAAKPSKPKKRGKAR